MMPDGHLTEAEWQGLVIELARVNGWTVAHFRPARTEHGWRTAVQADGAGFPDLVLARERVVFAELKRQKAKPTSFQAEWLAKLRGAGAEVYVWRPADWPAVIETLARPPRMER